MPSGDDESLVEKIKALSPQQQQYVETALDRMSRLAPAQRQAIQSREFDGMDWPDIVAKQRAVKPQSCRPDGMTVKNVMMAYIRGRRFLQREVPFVFDLDTDDVGY